MKLEGKFLTMERANEALSKLKAAGFNNSYVEIDDNNRNIRRNLADTNTAYSLSNLTIDPLDMKKAPLTTISPLVNIRAGFSEFNDNNYKLVVDSDSNSFARAENIIKSLGGKFETENTSVGRVTEEVGELNEKFKKNGI
jgi:hypothetical protein